MITYDIKELFAKSPSMVPGIDDVMFTVSVKYDVVAIDPNGNIESTSLRVTKEHPEKFRDNTIFVYK